MEKKHPKRLRDQYNPYWIYEVEGQPFLEFRDGQGHPHSFEISRELYEAFDLFEREDARHIQSVRKHYEGRELSEEMFDTREAFQSEELEETVFKKIRKEALHKAIKKLPKKQKRRLILYYFYEMTYQEIAKIEGCATSSVMESVKSAIKKLKKFLK